MYRKILHLDLDAFYCAVEELRDPSLIGIPFAVGGRPDQRGVVASCSYSARQFGVRSAMPMSRAMRLCPGLRIIPGNYAAYGKASKQVMEYLKTLTPLVEQISIDEAFLDVTNLPENGREIAVRLQKAIQDNVGLPCSLGVATNKLLAKTANDVGKASSQNDGPPNAITVVTPGEEAAFLAPLPVEALWGIGPKTAERLEKLGILTIGELAERPPAELTQTFGKIGYDLSQRAQGIDNRPIITHHEPKSFSQETTFAQDVRSEETLRSTIRSLSKGVGRRLRASGKTSGTVKLKIRWPDFTTITRQMTLTAPTDQDSKIFEAASSLFEQVWQEGNAVRLIGVGVSSLTQPSRQLSLWDARPKENTEKERNLVNVIEDLRARYGAQVLQRGRDWKPGKDDEFGN